MEEVAAIIGADLAKSVFQLHRAAPAGASLIETTRGNLMERVKLSTYVPEMGVDAAPPSGVTIRSACGAEVISERESKHEGYNQIICVDLSKNVIQLYGAWLAVIRARADVQAGYHVWRAIWSGSSPQKRLISRFRAAGLTER